MPQDRPATRRRSDGVRTHAAILDAATRIASVEGINGLTLGRLARELGVSKSGLYAHFGSKEQLQLETIEAARVVLADEVLAPALAAPPGLRRLEAFCAAYFSYVERRVFPGGCFFANVLAEVDAQPGPLRQQIAEDYLGLRELLESCLADARGQGEIVPSSDPAQLAFEVTAALEQANFMYLLWHDAQQVARGRTAVQGIVERSKRRPRRVAQR